MTPDCNVCPPKQPSSGLILIYYWIAIRALVLNTSPPYHLTIERNVTVAQIRRIHYIVDVEDVRGQYHAAVGTAFCKSSQDRRRIVGWLTGVVSRRGIYVA